ncbi:formate dehydrogenase [Alsobacter soli]|uniref:Formate dehydrogenase n=1 Tax=Alsobacter soli TaxID=2109933 RepID=A0A2T1HRI5_9HYPH|nr:twin-arginine translocation signal domain-containing protein [Alsobacter soli]PSC04255.1 formate dehydrogenase [Alsobacter soli]
MAKAQRGMSRRGLLKGLSSGTLALGAAAAAVAPEPAEAYDPGPTEMRGRYRETDHVKAYYRVNGYETLKK